MYGHGDRPARKRRGANNAATFDYLHQRESSLDLEVTVIQSVVAGEGWPCRRGGHHREIVGDGLAHGIQSPISETT